MFSTVGCTNLLNCALTVGEFLVCIIPCKAVKVTGIVSYLSYVIQRLNDMTNPELRERLSHVF